MLEKIAVVLAKRISFFALDIDHPDDAPVRFAMISGTTISEFVVQKAGNQRGSFRTSPTIRVWPVSATTPQSPCVFGKRG